VFDVDGSFSFANPAAVVGPGAELDGRAGRLAVVPRLAAVIGANGSVGGFTVCSEWRDRGRSRPKDRDFALGLGPAVLTWDGLDPDGLGALVRVDGRLEVTGAFSGFDWQAAVVFAADGTELRPGDVIAGPGLGLADAPEGSAVEIEVEGIGVLDAAVAAGETG
jgi:2-keto-4-pentenoate hydratase/2-oxohepta-3-ene-1,7-dioic acid hydratase in catechol pathway